MGIYDMTHELARMISQSEEAAEYKRLKAVAEADETNSALLKEFKRLQLALQMRAVGGQDADAEDMQRFSQISSLLYMNSDVQAYLLAEMRLQKMMADVYKIITEASGLEMPGA